MKGPTTELLQNEQLGCAKTSSRYGEPAEEMGVQGDVLSGLARDTQHSTYVKLVKRSLLPTECQGKSDKNGMVLV